MTRWGEWPAGGFCGAMICHGHAQDTSAAAPAAAGPAWFAGHANAGPSSAQSPSRVTARADHPSVTPQEVSATMETTAEDDRRHGAVYGAKLGLLYHRKRERFFDLCDKLSKSFTVVLGASLLAEHVRAITPAIGALVSAVGLLALVFGYSDKKQRHKELAEEYALLQARIEACGTTCTMAEANQWHSDLHRLNAKEPPTLGTLVVICQNEIAIAEGKPDSVVPVGRYKQLFANWRDFPVAT